MSSLLRFVFVVLFLVWYAVNFTEAFADTTRPGWRETLIPVGEEAPNFSLPSNTGENINMSKYHSRKTLVLFFYPRAFSPACTREVQAFQEDLAYYERRGAVLLGVSVDEPKAIRQFAVKNELKFPLVSDAGGHIAHQYGVMGWIMAKRVTYIIGPDGLVKHVYPEVNVEEHSREVLRALGENVNAIQRPAARAKKGKH